MGHGISKLQLDWRITTLPEGLCTSVTWKAMPAGALLLIGPPMPDRSKVRGQTKSDPLALQVGVFALD